MRNRLLKIICILSLVLGLLDPGTLLAVTQTSSPAHFPTATLHAASFEQEALASRAIFPLWHWAAVFTIAVFATMPGHAQSHPQTAVASAARISTDDPYLDSDSIPSEKQLGGWNQTISNIFTQGGTEALMKLVVDLSHNNKSAGTSYKPTPRVWLQVLALGEILKHPAPAKIPDGFFEILTNEVKKIPDVARRRNDPIIIRKGQPRGAVAEQFAYNTILNLGKFAPVDAKTPLMETRDSLTAVGKAGIAVKDLLDVTEQALERIQGPLYDVKKESELVAALTDQTSSPQAKDASLEYLARSLKNARGTEEDQRNPEELRNLAQLFDRLVQDPKKIPYAYLMEALKSNDLQRSAYASVVLAQLPLSQEQAKAILLATLQNLYGNRFVKRDSTALDVTAIWRYSLDSFMQRAEQPGFWQEAYLPVFDDLAQDRIGFDAGIHTDRAVLGLLDHVRFPKTLPPSVGKSLIFYVAKRISNENVYVDQALDYLIHQPIPLPKSAQETLRQATHVKISKLTRPRLTIINRLLHEDGKRWVKDESSRKTPAKVPTVASTFPQRLTFEFFNMLTIWVPQNIGWVRREPEFFTNRPRWSALRTSS